MVLSMCLLIPPYLRLDHGREVDIRDGNDESRDRLSPRWLGSGFIPYSG